MKINRIKASIKLKREYLCSICGTLKLGDTEYYEFSDTNSASIKEQIDSTPTTSNNMPNGWSYNGSFTCCDCLNKALTNE